MFPVKQWLWIAGALLAAWVLLGAGTGRMAAVAATLTAVPLWRAAGPWMIRRLPGLAKNPAVHYCTGFLAVFSLAAAARLAGAAPVSELLGLSALWLFFSALATTWRDRPPHPSDPSGSY